MEDRPPRCMPAPPRPRINNPSVPFSPGESEQDSPVAYNDDKTMSTFGYLYRNIGGCLNSNKESDVTKFPNCRPRLDTYLSIKVGRTCGNSIIVTSKHRASTYLVGELISTTGWVNSDPVSTRQPHCPDDPPPSNDCGQEEAPVDGEPCESNGGDGGGSCEWYTCVTWYWYDAETGEILEIIGTYCYCS